MRLLMDGVHMLNTGNGVQPLKVDTRALLVGALLFTVAFRGVRGQQTAKRATEVAAAGIRSEISLAHTGPFLDELAEFPPNVSKSCASRRKTAGGHRARQCRSAFRHDSC